MVAIDWQVVATLGTWAGVILVFSAAVASFFVAHGRTSKRLEVVEERQEKHEKEFSAFRDMATDRFVSTAVINQLEQRVFDAIKQVGDRIEIGLSRLGDRLDKVFDARTREHDRDDHADRA